MSGLLKAIAAYQIKEIIFYLEELATINEHIDFVYE
jgi:hypothetical protein